MRKLTLILALSVLPASTSDWLAPAAPLTVRPLDDGWVETEGEARVINITPEAARRRALQAARQRAIEYAVGIDVLAQTYLRREERGEDAFLMLSEETSAGRIVEEKAPEWKLYEAPGDGVPVMVYRVRLRVRVQEEKGPPDPDFRVRVELNKEHFLLFHKHFADQLETASKPFVDQEPRFIYDYPAEVFMVVSVLKGVYTARKDLKSYLSLCEKTTTSPKDCEQLVGLCKAKKRFVDALAWVEKGLALEKRRQWGNQSSLGLGPMKQELLRKLGRSEEALDAAWSEFKNHPSMYGYEDVMKCVSKADVAQWHRKAMDVARAGPLSGCIEICTRTKEWDMLSERIAAAKHEELEDVSHYYSEGAAKGLAKHHKQAAAKVYRALGMRIVKAGKSKYYQHALAHLQKARKLYEKTGQAEQWQSIVCMIRRDHSRKSSFIGPFEVIAAGGKQDSPASFERIVQKRWKKQTSGAPSKGHGPRIE